MLYLERPNDFESRFDVVSCFVEDQQGRILLLLRHDHKPQGGTWGVPAGKVEQGEELTDAIIRELAEEMGYYASSDEVIPRHMVYVTFPEYSFRYHIYTLQLKGAHDVVLEESCHKAYRWVTPEEALTMHLIQDEAPCIELCYGPFSEAVV